MFTVRTQHELLRTALPDSHRNIKNPLAPKQDEMNKEGIFTALLEKPLNA